MPRSNWKRIDRNFGGNGGGVGFLFEEYPD